MRQMPSFRILSTCFALALAAVASIDASAAPAANLAPHTRVTYPSAVSAEVLGRSMLYTVGFDQVMNDYLAAGAGIGTVSMIYRSTGNSANQTAVFVPVYMNFYFMKSAGSPYLTGGLTLITNYNTVRNLETATGSLEIPTSSVMPTFGGGYEHRGDTGFLFRVSAYVVAGRDLTPWLGFTFGYAF